MSITLPSKKIQALIIIVSSLFVAYIVSVLDVRAWFGSITANAGKAVYHSPLEVTSGGDASNDLDTDGDGLKDWQEALWGTDKNDKDSDRDGVKDGEEIEKGRDPKIAGPDDSLEKTRGISAASVTSFSENLSTDPDNLSTSVSHDLFAKFMSLHTTGGLDNASQEDLINSVITNIDPGSIPPRFTVSDVVIVDTNSASLKAYANGLAKIVITLQASAGPSSNNDSVISAYASALEKIKQLQVPGTLGINHLQILNNFNASYRMLFSLADYQKDPVKGLVAMKSFKTNAEDATTLFAHIAAELKNNDILFDSTEAGYIWNNYR